MARKGKLSQDQELKARDKRIIADTERAKRFHEDEATYQQLAEEEAEDPKGRTFRDFAIEDQATGKDDPVLDFPATKKIKNILAELNAAKTAKQVASVVGNSMRSATTTIDATQILMGAYHRLLALYPEIKDKNKDFEPAIQSILEVVGEGSYTHRIYTNTKNEGTYVGINQLLGGIPRKYANSRVGVHYQYPIQEDGTWAEKGLITSKVYDPITDKWKAQKKASTKSIASVMKDLELQKLSAKLDKQSDKPTLKLPDGSEIEPIEDLPKLNRPESQNSIKTDSTTSTDQSSISGLSDPSTQRKKPQKH